MSTVPGWLMVIPVDKGKHSYHHFVALVGQETDAQQTGVAV
jgi:hypothetical protein